MLVQTKNITVTDEMPGETEAMTFDPDSLEHLMDVLSDLYSSRTTAIVREYSTNALDAHAISGQTKPIEIRTPTRMNPNLVIQDYGPGMSRDMLSDVFKKYGRSTKRGNNLETGQLGLGSKSAFAYSDQFTVRSIHDGKCCEIVMSRNDRGAAEMNVVFEYDNDEDPSGVTVTIPIKHLDINDVHVAAAQFAQYATPGKVRLNGVINSRPSDWIDLGDGVFAVDGVYEHRVVMGNVAYPAPLFAHKGYSYRPLHFIVLADMGTLDFTPNREALKMTDNTKATLKALESKIESAISNHIQKSLSGSARRATKAKAFVRFERLAWYLPNNSPLDEAPLTEFTEYITAHLPYDINDSRDRVVNNNHKSNKKWYPKQLMSIRHLANEADTDIYAITDFPGLCVARSQAAKILAANDDFKGKSVYFFEHSQDEIADLFKTDNMLSWNDVQKVTVVKTPREKKVEKRGDLYLGRMVSGRRIQTGDKMMTTNGPAYYCSKQNFNYMSTRDFPRGDFKLFFVPPSKQAAFAQANPHAKSLEQYIQNRTQQISKHIRNSKRVKECIAWAARDWVTGWVDFNEVKHQGLLDAVARARVGSKWSDLSGSHSGYYGRFHEYVEEELPLVSLTSSDLRSDSKYRKHAIEYINMIGENNGKS